jgi:Primase C terminal 2 (PriCT-2)
MEKEKFVTTSPQKINASPEFAPSVQGSNPHGEPNGQNLSSSQNLTISQEILTKKRPIRTDISFSYCRELINKPVKNSDKAKTNFHSMSGNVDNIIDIYRKGFAVSPFHYRNNYKNSENATVAGLLIVDIDNQGWFEKEIIDGNSNNNEYESNNGYENQIKPENDLGNQPHNENGYESNNGCENQIKPENDLGNQPHNGNGNIINNGNGDKNGRENGNNGRKIVKQKVYQHQLTLEEYQSIDFCRKYTFAITTANHRSTWHRFRVFLPLPMDIDKTTYEVAVRHLNTLLNGAVDINATNPSIGFYGNSNGILYKSDDFQGLDYNWLSQLQPEVEKIKTQQEKQKQKLAKKIAKHQKKLAKSATARDIIEALSYVSSEDYDTWTRVGFALHHTFNGSDEGLEIYDNWSSKANNYSGRRVIEYKWESFSKSRTNKPITIATVFMWAIEQGYKPPRKIRRRLDARDYFEDYKTFSYPISLECHKNYGSDKTINEINPHNSNYLDNEINTNKKGYFPEEIIAQIPRQGLVFIQGDMGTGKTYLAEKIVREFKAQGKYVLSPDSTRSLCQQSANRYGIYYKTHDDTTPIKNLRSQGIKTTYDSFAKYENEAPDCIIFDEILSSEYHLLLGNTKVEDNREDVIFAVRSVVKSCIEKGGLVLCMDEMLLDLCIDLMKDFAGDIEPFIVVNHYRNNNYKTYQLLNADDPKKILFTMPTLGLKPFYCCDSQKEVIALYKELSETFPEKNFKHIHQGNANQPENKKLLNNPTLWLQNNQCDGLIVSPTIVCGFSIEGNLFDAVIGNFFGVLPVNQCRQMLRRIRSDIPRYVYASSHGLSYANQFDYEKITEKAIAKKKNKLDLLRISNLIARSDSPKEIIATLNSMIDSTTDTWKNIELTTQSKYIAFINAGKANYRENIFTELAESGSTIIYNYTYDSFVSEFEEVGFTNKKITENSNKNFKTIIKNHKEGVINQKAKNLAHADTHGMNREESEYILTNQHRYDDDEIAKAQKFIYQEMLPSVELTEDFIKEFLLKNNHKLKSVERHFWLNNFSLLKKKETIKTLNWLGRSKNLIYLEHNNDDLLPQVHLLKLLEVQKFIELDGYFTKNDKSINSFFKRAIKHGKELKEYFNLEVTKDSKPIKVLRNLLKTIGISLESKVKKINKKVTRIYIVDKNYLDDTVRQSILDSYKIRNTMVKTVKEKLKKISHIFLNHKKPEIITNNGIEPNEKGNKTDFISYNNQVNFVT